PGAAHRDGPRPGVGRMRVVIVAIVGSVFTLAFARAARRYAVADRLRVDRGARARRMPAGVHDRLVRALDAAAIDVTPARAMSTWGWSIIVAAALGLAVGGVQIAAGTTVLACIGPPVVVLALRERRSRRIAAAVPEMLERVASELRSGGTI